jgi:hypothetical protein
MAYDKCENVVLVEMERGNSELSEVDTRTVV